MITQSSLQSCPWIWEGDPALDKESPKYNRDAYEKTGDLAHLPTVEGRTATVFHVKRLTRKQFFRVMSLSVTEQVQEAVAFGLSSVEPASLVPLSRKSSDVGERLTDGALDALYELGPQVLIAMGSFVMGLSRPDPT